MSSISLPNFSTQTLNRSFADRLLSLQTDLLPLAGSVQRTATAKFGELSRSESAKAAVAIVAAVPSTLDLRFEFNAVTQAWMLTMTNSGSGDVVRKLAIAAFSGSKSALVHRSAMWIDKAV